MLSMQYGSQDVRKLKQNMENTRRELVPHQNPISELCRAWGRRLNAMSTMTIA